MDQPPDWLAADLTSLAFCIAMVRPDGVKLGLTSHDRPIEIAGLVHHPNPGMTPSAIVRTAGGDGDSMSVAGGFSFALVSEFDLDVGRWTGGRISCVAADWRAPSDHSIELFSGWIGDVRRTRKKGAGQFAIDVQPHWSRLDRSGPPSCAPLCRARLGDDKCGVDMSGRSVDRRVTASVGPEILLDAALANPEHYLAGGLRWLSGPLTGTWFGILQAEAGRLLVDGLREVNGLGEARVRIFEGCDGRFSTCRLRFGNEQSFQGEPHVPGTDALLRYEVD
jgi:uncharacterized phage protein (TIGR02218 family)